MDETALAERDILHSRQWYVIGDEGMRKLSDRRVYLSGLGGVGVEILKNLILLGVGEVVIEDEDYVTEDDLKINFVVNKDDVFDKRNKAEVCREKLSQLNPDVKIGIAKKRVDLQSDLVFLRQFNCVVLTEKILPLLTKVNQFCRDQSPPIPFISTDVKGVCGWCFVDLGKEIEITDVEETDQEIRGFVSKIHPNVVTVWGNKSHDLENGDRVRLKSVNEDDKSLDEKIFQVQILSRQMFTTDVNLGDFDGEVVISPIKTLHSIKYESLSDQLYKPTIISLSNGTDNKLTHLAILAFYIFLGEYNRLPLGENDNDLIFKSVEQLNKEHFNSLVNIDRLFVNKLFFAWNKTVQPLSSLFGGFAAQEVLKCLTGKFTPLHQWFNFDCSCLVDLSSKSIPCLDEVVSTKLKDLNVFLVGCGAIGCEILKNCALLGIGTSKGQLHLVDHDRVELSNLSNQCLYRAQHVGQFKSSVAAEAAKTINSDINIATFPLQVCPQTEDIFTDEFFSKIDVIITAIDNAEGRRYLDSQSIKYTRPMFDSGMDGNKGHVQVIIPHESEHYSKHFDVPDEDFPYCTLKSFPATIEHTVQWARDKFDSLFHFKPNAFNKFWKNNPDLNQTIDSLNSGVQVDSSALVTKILRKRPRTSQDCIHRARILFEKYFNHKACQLLHTFSRDSKFDDGSEFWQFPKRAPAPVLFLPWNKLHIDFIRSCAQLLAINYNIKEHIPENMTNILLSQQIPEFVPKNKRIETDESKKKSESESPASDSQDDQDDCVDEIKRIADVDGHLSDDVFLFPSKFCIEDPLHLDFIEATSNLRAVMYGINTENRLVINKLAGNIFPAIVTTSSVVASLLTVELLKHVSGLTSIEHRNYFFNLALPMVVCSEPGPTNLVHLKDGFSFSIWDRWEIQGNPKFTLQEFLDRLANMTAGLKVSLVVDGTKIVYLPYLPGHDKRRKQEMTTLIAVEVDKQFCDLSVAFEGDDGEDLMGPRVRYYLT